MKTLKKFFGVVLALAMVLSCLMIASAANTANVSVGSVKAEAGDTVAITYSVSEATFATYSLVLDYDTGALELQSVAKGKLSQNGMFSANTKADSPKLGTISYITDADFTGSGVLFTATFKVSDDAAPGSYTVSAKNVSFNAADTSSLSVSVSAGSVNIPSPHVHSYTEKVTAPTCTEKGYTTYTCTCGDSYTGNEVAAEGHSYAEKVTAPTCTEKGYTTYTCTCGDSYIGNEVAAKGHSHAEKVTAPTCIEKGYTTYTCTCGDSYTDNEVAAKGHDATGVEPVFVWAKDHSCKASYTCNVCDKKDSVIAKVSVESSDASCTTAGTATYTASVVLGGKTWTSDPLVVSGQKTPHSYKAEFTWSEDYTSAGLVLTCPDCGDIVDIDAADVEVSVETTDATSEADGKIVYTASCTYKGVTYTDEYVEILEKLPGEEEPLNPDEETPVDPDEDKTSEDENNEREEPVPGEENPPENDNTVLVFLLIALVIIAIAIVIYVVARKKRTQE